MRENKQKILDALCVCLRLTSNAGFEDGNPLVNLLLIQKGHDEFVRPVFADGTGNDGYYDVCVSMDSGTAMIVDVCNGFVRKMW